MHEIDIIKHLILDDNQVSLFNFSAKPAVSSVSKSNIIESLTEKFNIDFNDEEIDKLYNSFCNIALSKRKSEIDLKLLKITASEIDNLIAD